jgi:outer membrane protein assembly factor BamB
VPHAVAIIRWLSRELSPGALLWSFTAGGFVYSSPAVADGVVYVGSYNGNVYALGLANEDT